jgi:DNA-binding protein Fis
VWVLWYARKRVQENPILLLTIVLMLIWNGAEFLSFSEWRQHFASDFLLYSYYTGLTLTTGALAHVVAKLFNIEYLAFYIGLWVITLCCTLLVALPGLALLGHAEISYSITRVPGPLYPLWQLYIVSVICVMLGALLYGSVQLEELLQRRRSFALLIGLSPLLGTGIVILISMQLGMAINGTMLLSLMSSFFLLTLLYTEQRYNLFRLLSFVPYTPERELNRRFEQAVNKIRQDSYTATDNGFKEPLKELETLCLQMAVYAADGNKTQAARNIGISSATLHRKLPTKT